MTILSGVRILELGAIGPVPWCAMLLADMGADIVCIDRPGGSARGPASGRGRTRVELDLKRDNDLAQALELVGSADALIEGMRPGATERLGIGPEACLARNPALVYARMTGWGQHGPLSARAGHDINYIGLSGVLHAIGPRDRPALPLNLVGDYGGGGAYLAIGLLAALLKARQTGQGEVVDVAMVDGAASLMTLQYDWLAEGRWRDERAANPLDGGAPWYDVYACSDGKFMAVGAIEPAFYAQLLEGLGLQAAQVPDRADRSQWPVIRTLFAQRFAQHTRDEWTERFAATDACVTPVLSMAEAPSHPHNAERQTFLRHGQHPVPGPAPRFGSAPRELAAASTRATAAEAVARWASPRKPPAAG
jgi:alpha-methylacyl-CoA racemase